MQKTKGEIFVDNSPVKESFIQADEIITTDYDELYETSFLNKNDDDFFYGDKDELRFK